MVLNNNIRILLSQIDEWLEYAPTLLLGSEFENACSYMDVYMEKRTFFVSLSFSIADIAIWSGLAGKLQNSSLFAIFQCH